MARVFKTAIFKLHSPSIHKKKVLDHALLEYTQGKTALLEYAQDNIDFDVKWSKYDLLKERGYGENNE